jgi:hypothetical protein
MALQQAARVIAAADVQEARDAFERGVALIASAAPEARTRGLVQREAVRLGTSVHPDAALAILRQLHADGGDRFDLGSLGVSLVAALVELGEMERALELLEDLSLEAGGAGAVMHHASDAAIRLRALRASRVRWLRFTEHRSMMHDEFPHLFSQFREMVPLQEAEAWVDEILTAAATTRDRAGRWGFGNRVEFDRESEALVFIVLNVIRAVKSPERVESILSGYSKVAEAAQVYPLGLESVLNELRPAEGLAQGRRGFGSVGAARDLATMPDRLAAHAGDLDAIHFLLEDADRMYREDTDPEDPNAAARVFWPSCHAYKVAMYAAGKALRMEAEPLLGRIVDADFALLASIELAAGALGLREHAGVRSTNHPKRFRASAPGNTR